MKKKNTRSVILKIHKILGIATGIVLFIVSITGCMWAFKEEIENTYSDYKNVSPQKANFIKASEVKAIAEIEIPNKEIHGVIYGGENEALEVVFYQTKPQLFYQSLFINPYTGEVLKKINHNKGFFAFVLKGHLRLWLPEAVGSRLVSYSVLLFFTLLITGVFLWKPKNKKNRVQRFKFQWKKTTRWKRKNFDLHAIVGFYVASFALIFAFTGCVMAFNWFYYIAFKTAGGDKDPRFLRPNSKNVVVEQNTYIYDRLIPQLYNRHKDATTFELHYPTNDTTSILVEISNTKGLHYNMDYQFFDQNTLEEIETNSIYGKYENADFADKVIRMNYDIHIGSIGGIVGKIIAFLTSLICATLPVSGILLWYGRKNKTKQKKDMT